MPKTAAHPALKLHLDIRIRRCRRSDLRHMEWYGQYTCHRAIFEEAYARSRRGEVIMLVADLRGFPVGQVWIDLTRSGEAGVATLWALRVFPFLNGCGIGKALVTAAENVLRRRGAKAVELGVEKDAPAAAFYERLGYVTTGEKQEAVTYDDPAGGTHTMHFDQWWMRKELTSGPKASPAEEMDVTGIA